MNIKQVSYFVSVAHHGSLSAAAREQGISVQAMSKAMTDLEKSLPTALFVRTHQGIQLTTFGEQFYYKAKPVCAAFDELESLSECPIDDSVLKLFLVSPAFSSNSRARASMAAFFDKFLGTHSEVSIGTGEVGLTKLDRGECDALITIGTFDDPRYDCFTAGTIPAGVCLAKNHPLAKNERVTLAELNQYPVLASQMFDHFNDSIVVLYDREKLLDTVLYPDGGQMPYLFYFKHGVCFMVNIPPLGEMLPFSVMVPLAKEDAKAIPLCLITSKGVKSPAYQRLEALLKNSL